MCPNSQFPGDLVTFNEEILNGKLHLLCSVHKKQLNAISSNEERKQSSKKHLKRPQIHKGNCNSFNCLFQKI